MERLVMNHRGTFLGLSASMSLAVLAAAQPGSYTDWGTHTTAETIDRLVTLTAANDIQWFKIVLPAVSAGDGYVDIWNMPTATPTPALDISDSEIGVYDNNGNLVASDDDDGAGLWSQLSFGQTSPTRPGNPISGQTNGLAFAGQDGPLAGGTYWIAVGHYNVTFNTTGWNVTTTYASTQRTTQLFVRVQPAGAPIPPSGTGTATPNNVAQGAPTLLTVNVTPGANPPSTGLSVEMNLGAIGGSATQALYDDGTNGDTAGGDGVFSYLMNVPGSTAAGAYSLPFTIRDAQSRSGGGNTALSVYVPPQWDETVNGGGDAGNLPSACQTPTGTDPFQALTGNIEFSGDVDMYRIRICDPGNFSASTANTGTVISDTQIFLFNDRGVGVTYNDDDSAGGGGLRSRITSQFIPGPGTYYLAVTGYNADPIDEGGNLLWINTPFGTERVPDGPGAANAVSAWTGTSGTGVYRVNMSGVCFDGGTPPCDPDYNQDGNADQDDVAYLTNVIAGGGNPTGRDPDFNGDGNVDQDDYAALVNVIAGAPCP
jgi:hypothetical protein